ncbi:MAG TPA: aldehyde dehydrogenase family protein [Cyanobacteria bacterium UBA8530]|nr:aldehyde dehydrogenase family protein [Cyanobacteria bacterium UBA8530]
MKEAIELEKKEIVEIVEKQRRFFAIGKTRSVDFRIEQLLKLKAAIEGNEKKLLAALGKDLGKSEIEGYLSEIGLSLGEIDHMVRYLEQYARPKKVKTPLIYFGARSFVVSEPLGVVLILAPWNYPFQLLVSPLIGALAAGNCAVLKPSELAGNVSSAISEILRSAFPEEYLAVFEGGVETSTTLLDQKFDHIFFTGGEAVGKVVMKAAARHLTPVTLELGGKSPCIVEEDADLAIAARRIAWGKFLNAGQTCVAPDYLLVQKNAKRELLDFLKATIQDFFGADPIESPFYGRIIDERHFDRLEGLLADAEVFSGGHRVKSEKYFEPTLLHGVSPDSPIMSEEIFGPLLPVLEYEKLSDAIAFVNGRPKPLALYFFSGDKEKQQRILRETSSGGVCLNDTVIHISTNDLPFGGVGASGMGSYHGRASFDTFSHRKGVLRNTQAFDLKLKYPPYRLSLAFLKKMMPWTMR